MYGHSLISFIEQENDDGMLAIVDICVFTENHNIAIFHGKTMIFWISTENPKIIFGYPWKIQKYFGFPQKIQNILDIQYPYPQKIHNIIGLPPWENNNIVRHFTLIRK